MRLFAAVHESGVHESWFDSSRHIAQVRDLGR
jgi:hypothetical protein